MAEDIWGGAVDRTIKRHGFANTLTDQDPVLTRRANRIGQTLGLSGQEVAADVEGYEKAQQAESAKTIFDYAPGLAAFAAVPNNAASVKDDLPALGEISKIFGMQPPEESLSARYMKSLKASTAKPGQFKQTIGVSRPRQTFQQSLTTPAGGPQAAFALGVAEQALITIPKTFRAITETGARLIGMSDELNQTSGWQSFKDDIARADYDATVQYDPVGTVTLPLVGDIKLNPAQWAFSASTSLAQLGLARGIAGRGNTLAAISTMSGADQYSRSRDRGASVEESLAAAVLTGGIEAGTEKLPLDYIFQHFGKEGAAAFAKGLLFREIPGEVMATIGQGAVDARGTGGEGLEAWTQHLPQDIVDTIAATTLMVGAMGTGSSIMNRIRPQLEDQADIGQALAGAQFLDSIMTNAESSKLKAEDPETFRQFVERHAEGTPVRNVYIPAETVATYMQSEGYEKGSLERFSEQIAEAQATGGDVVIPIAEAAAYLAGTPAWQALRDDARITPGGFSQKEAAQKSEELFQSLEAEGKALGEQAEAAGIERAAIDEVKEDVKNAIISTGRASAKNAEAVASVVAARYAAVAARRGTTPMQEWQKAKISFLGKGEGQTAGRMMAAQDEAPAATPLEELPDDTLEAVLADPANLSPEHQEALGLAGVPLTKAGKLGKAGTSALSGEQERRKAAAPPPPAQTLFQGSAQQVAEDLGNHVPGWGNIAPFLADDEKAGLREAAILKIIDMVETFPGAEEMASVAFAGRAKKGWYERSAQAILDVFGLEDAPRFAALLAAMSPQTSVEQNTIAALQMWMNWDAAGRPTDAKTIKALMGKSVPGNKGMASVLDAWVNNTVRALTADNPADVKLSGPKVNSFMLNLVGEVDEVTNDAWMANWALIDQQIFRSSYRKINGEKIGQKGPGYLAMNALVRRAADILTARTGELWTPSNVQEAVWSFTKIVTEARDAAGSKSVDQLLQMGGITHADIGETPDFAMLFQRGIYRRILEEGGYGEAAAQLAIDTGGTDGPSGGAGSVADATGSGIDPAVFLGHLRLTGERIEQAVSGRRKTKRSAQLDLFENYDSTPLDGLPTSTLVDGVPRVFGPHAPIRESARRYMLRNGLPYNPPTDYVKVDVERATRIAEAFEAMKHNPEDPETKRAYRALIDETVAQYRQLIKDTGLVVEFIEGADPYGNPRNAILDVVENNHLWVFPTEAGFGGPASGDVDISGNPLLEIVPGIKISGRPVTANDLFRVVHDVFGHIKEGVGFRADGEENAWRMHSAMYSPLARRAMTTETRGQNSWVNFGPFGETNRTASGADTEYAPQKIGLLPLWVSEEGTDNAPPVYQDVLPEAGWQAERLSGLIDRYGLDDGSSSAIAVMMTPDEFLAALASEKGVALIEDRVDQMVEYGPLDIEKLRAAGPPVITIAMTPGGDKSGPMVRGHDGRHRAMMMKKAGIGQMPVVIQLMDKEGKPIHVSEETAIENALPNRSRSEQMSNGSLAVNTKGIPISWKFHDQLRLMTGQGRVLFQSQEEVFYSALQRAVQDSKTTKAPGAQWIATLRKTPGIKQEELELTGILDLLENTEGPVTKEQLAALLEEKGIQVEEVMLGQSHADARERGIQRIMDDMGWDRAEAEETWDNDTQQQFELSERQDGTQFDSWSSDPSNSTYRELLITLPLGVRGNPKRAASTHWDTEGVIAHTRFMDKTDAEGKRVLFVEEVQSDWHQKGRDQGYQQAVDPEVLRKAEEALKTAQELHNTRFNEHYEAGKKAKELLLPWLQRAYKLQVEPAIERLKEQGSEAVAKEEDDGKKLEIATEYVQRQKDLEDIFSRQMIGMMESPTQGSIIGYFAMEEQRQRAEQILSIRGEELPAEVNEAMEAFNSADTLYRNSQDTVNLRSAERNAAENTAGIPNAPFKSSWPALVMKRIMRYAAENGYDRVAWTTGKEQAERYNLGVATGPIKIEKMDDGRYDVGINGNAQRILLEQDMAEEVVSGDVSFLRRLVMTPEQMTQAFGRDIANRLVEGAEKAFADKPARTVKMRELTFKAGQIQNDIAEYMNAVPAADRNMVKLMAMQKRLDDVRKEEHKLSDARRFKLSGEGLQVGGEGMKAFYDRNLVNITNDLIKKYGAKVGPVNLASNGADAQEARRVLSDPEMNAPEQELAKKILAGEPHPGFDVTEKMREAVLKGQPLFQQERGSISIMDNGEKIIQLFANADPSTLIHELSHAWLEELRAEAIQPDADPQVKADWATIKAWFRDNGMVVRDTGPIPTPAHELFARGGERYVMEGKAPTSALNSAFNMFRAWLTRIYEVVENLNSPITPEVREVFSRLLATQEEIDAQARIQGTAPLFKSAEDAGMTEAEFAAYTDSVGNAKDEAYNALLFKTMEALRKAKTAERRTQRATIREEVATTVGRQPQFVALHLLRTGYWLGDPDRPKENVKLNTGWLIDNFGEDILDKLPRGLPITRGDGLEGDAVAEMVGMASGAELVQTLVGMRAASDQLRASGEKRSLRDKMVDEEVDRIMTERHGDTLNDGTIEEEAIAALNTAAQGEIISGEIRQLGKRTSIPGRVTPYQMVRAWAKRKITAGKVNDVVSRGAMQRYTRAAAKASRAAEEAILKGDIDEAYKQKQAHLINHALLAEAKAAADRVDTIVAKMKRLSKRAAQRTIDPEYLAKVHMLLENYDFRARSQRSIDEQEGFEVWLLDQRAKGYEVHIPPRLENNGTPYSRVSVEELEALNDLVDSLLHLGRTKQKLKTAQGERDFAEWRDEALATMEQLPNRKLPEKPINEERRVGASMAAELLKIETIAEELDGGPTGPFNDLLTVGSVEAENQRVRLREKVMKPLLKMYHGITGKYWKRLQEKVTIHELTWNTLNEGDPRVGQPVTITRMELLAIALNTGNLSNLEKMAKGERWPVATIQAVLQRELTKEDWDLVQSLWSQVGKLWPDIVATEREMSGVVPEQVTSIPIDTRFGTYEGGYWPVVYDAARWQRAEDIEGQKVDDMFGLKSGVATQKGHTIERTSAFGPINFNLESILFNHIEQVVTRIAYAPFAREVLRAIRDKRIRGMIDTKLGPEYRKAVEPWLQRQINEGAALTQGARWWSSVLRQFRINMTIAAMGFRISTGLAQTLGLTASAQRIGARWVGTGMKRLALNPRKATQFVWDRSEEMLHRTENFSREMNELSRKMEHKHGWFTGLQTWAMWHIGMMDRYIVAVPTWLGAYEKATRTMNMSDEEASRFADKSVRLSQGSGREKDLSWVQSMSNGEAFRFMTMFYTPFNVLFNAQWQGVRGLRKGDIRPAISVTFWWMMASMLGDALLSGDWPEDKDEDGELGLGELGGWFGRNVFFGMFAGVPLVRDLAAVTERKLIGQYGAYQDPVTRVWDAAGRASQIGKDYVTEGELPDDPIKTTGNLAAVFTGLPIGQPATTGQFLWDYSEGATDPETVADWYFGLTKAKVPSEEGN